MEQNSSSTQDESFLSLESSSTLDNSPNLYKMSLSKKTNRRPASCILSKDVSIQEIEYEKFNVDPDTSQESVKKPERKPAAMMMGPGMGLNMSELSKAIGKNKADTGLKQSPHKSAVNLEKSPSLGESEKKELFKLKPVVKPQTPKVEESQPKITPKVLTKVEEKPKFETQNSPVHTFPIPTSHPRKMSAYVANNVPPVDNSEKKVSFGVKLKSTGYSAKLADTEKKEASNNSLDSNQNKPSKQSFKFKQNPFLVQDKEASPVKSLDMPKRERSMSHLNNSPGKNISSIMKKFEVNQSSGSDLSHDSSNQTKSGFTRI